MIGEKEIRHRFGSTAVNLDVNVASAHDDLREAFIVFAIALDELLPNCREKSVAFTELQSSSMWAHKALSDYDSEDA